MNAKNSAQLIKQLIIKLWIYQLGLLALAVSSLWWLNPVIAYSVGIGGLIFWLPNAYFALMAFRHIATGGSADLLRSIYRGEANKFALTAIGFAMVFVFVKPLSVISLFIAFLAMTVIQWILVSRWQL